MQGDVKAQLILSVADVVVNHGLPALVRVVSSLNDKNNLQPITVEDILAVKGDLDSAEYFK